MNLALLTVSSTLAFSMMNASAQAAEGNLTVYSGDFESVAQSEGQVAGPGFALYERLISFDLKSGTQEVAYSQLPRALDASSVLLKPEGNASIRGQRFDFAVAGQEELLRRALGQTVTVEQSVGNDRQSFTGVLMAAGSGLTLRLPDGRIKVLSTYSSFELPRMPDGVANEPTLRWALQSPSAGRQNFALSYATAGLAWRAEYAINTHGLGKDCKMDVEGAAMVVNRSGVDFNDVMLTLVAGEPNRTRSNSIEVTGSRVQMANSKMVMADGAPDAQVSGEYQAYKLPNSGSLPQGSVQRLPLVNASADIACERRYETSYNLGNWVPPYPIIDENYGAGENQELPVLATLRFKNSKASGLGMPLPAGRVRLFDGKDFLGEAYLNHTAGNQDVILPIGTLFDLKAKRTRDSFTLDRDGRSMVEKISLTLSNAKKNTTSVRVTERLPRWSDWEMLSSSQPFDKRNAQTISFDVQIASEGETTLTYTVRYRWAPNVKIP